MILLLESLWSDALSVIAVWHNQSIHPSIHRIQHLGLIVLNCCAQSQFVYSCLKQSIQLVPSPHLRSVISVYVTFKKFTPGLQKFYMDISAISATFSNSDLLADM